MKTLSLLTALFTLTLLGGCACSSTEKPATVGVLPGKTPFNTGLCGTPADYAVGTRKIYSYNGQPCYYVKGKRYWHTGAVVNPNTGEPVNVNYDIVRNWNPDGTWKWNWKLGQRIASL